MKFLGLPKAVLIFSASLGLTPLTLQAAGDDDCAPHVASGILSRVFNSGRPARRTVRRLDLSGSFSTNPLESRIMNSSAASIASSVPAEVAQIAANEKAKPLNLKPWMDLATEVFKKTKADLRLVDGSGFSAQQKKAFLSGLELALDQKGIPKNVTGTLSLNTFYQFNSGGGTLLFQLAIKKKVYAVQVYVPPSGNAAFYVGKTPPDILEATPPVTTLSGAVLGQTINGALNRDNVQLGPVNEEALGNALLPQLTQSGMPGSGFSFFVGIDTRIAGNNGNSLVFLGYVIVDQGAQGNVIEPYYFEALLESDGSFSVQALQSYAEPLYPVTDPQTPPVPGSPFSYP